MTLGIIFFLLTTQFPVLTLIFVKSIGVQVQGVFGLHGLAANLALVNEGVWEVYAFNMIHNVVLLCIRFPTKCTLKMARRFLYYVSQKYAPVMS